jgi:hypothetical protein
MDTLSRICDCGLIPISVSARSTVLVAVGQSVLVVGAHDLQKETQREAADHVVNR